MKKEWELIKNLYGCTTILMQEEEARETKNAFEVIEKSLKALEIIKKKDVNIWYLTVSTKVKNYKDYNSFLMNDKGKRQLTQEEFNLLKEVLE